MGQKVHPLSFRLGITQEHKTKWYAAFSEYANHLKYCDELRNIWTLILKQATKKQRDEIVDRTNIVIEYPPTREQVQLTLFCLNPELVIFDLKSFFNPKVGISNVKTVPSKIRLSTSLSKELKQKDLVVILKKVKSPNVEANFLLQSAVNKLEKRMPFRRVLRTVLSDFQKGAKRVRLNPRRKGIKIQIAGRLNGAEIARTQWVRKGKVPLHTLQAKLEYSTARAETIYGTLGLKIWLCKG